MNDFTVDVHLILENKIVDNVANEIDLEQFIHEYLLKAVQGLNEKARTIF